MASYFPKLGCLVKFLAVVEESRPAAWHQPADPQRVEAYWVVWMVIQVFGWVAVRLEKWEVNPIAEG